MFSRLTLAATAALLLSLAVVPLAHAEGRDPAKNPVGSDDSTKTTATQTATATKVEDGAHKSDQNGATKAGTATDDNKNKAGSPTITPTSAGNSGGGKTDTATTAANSGSGKGGGKLDGDKLKQCQQRQATIDGLVTRLVTRGQKQMELIDKVSAGIQKLVTDKKLTVTDYATLLADLNAKKAVAQTAVDAIKPAQGGFTCDGTDPKGAISTFQDKLKTMNDAIKAYRDSVRALIKAVVKTTGNAGGTPSPAPAPSTTTPTPTPAPTTASNSGADDNNP